NGMNPRSRSLGHAADVSRGAWHETRGKVGDLLSTRHGCRVPLVYLYHEFSLPKGVSVMTTHLSLSAGPHTATPRSHGGVSMARTRATPFNLQTFLARAGDGITSLTSPKKQILFSQGDTAESVFY